MVPPSALPSGTTHTGPGGPGWQPQPKNNPMPSPTPTPPNAGNSSASAKRLGKQVRKHGGLVGVAHHVQQRSEMNGSVRKPKGWRYSQATVQVLAFRLEQYDRNGNRSHVYDVE